LTPESIIAHRGDIASTDGVAYGPRPLRAVAGACAISATDTQIADATINTNDAASARGRCLMMGSW
jgi:hypothetical protein